VTRLFGLDFTDAESVREVADACLSFEPTVGSKLPLLVTPNVDHLVQLRDASAELVESTCEAAFVLPDGQPIVWASRLMGARLPARLAGSDLFAELWPRICDRRIPVLVIAPTAAVAEALDTAPSAATLVAPVFGADDLDARSGLVDDALAAMTTPAAHVFVCLGQPKQQLIALELLERWPSERPPLVHCVGAAPEMYLGLVARAPEWMRRTGLEWFFRFLREPRRLFRRYFVADVVFVKMVWKEWRSRR
jgi:N-acetylglucosaminyldiphosphoundecaprenol N-acetyl-beta-D-mannosaminyltransferase